MYSCVSLKDHKKNARNQAVCFLSVLLGIGHEELAQLGAKIHLASKTFQSDPCKLFKKMLVCAPCFK